MKSAARWRAVASELLRWHKVNPRDLPWKETDDPYRTWISEIILQQTQVAQGIPYYFRFLEQFPTVQDLAVASEGDVLKSWQGLGYNSRALNLHRAAQSIVEDWDGALPDNAEDLRKLPGIGPYTAAAIASFAFGEQIGVVDTNVLRVVARLTASTDLVSSTKLRRQVEGVMAEIVKYGPAAELNQAIMNFGAVQCSARRPNCRSCPLARSCQAHRGGVVDIIPVKPERKTRKERHFHYLAVASDTSIIMRKRDGDDIWPHMYDFPCIEQAMEISDGGVRDWVNKLCDLDGHGAPIRATASQVLSHQKIVAHFYRVNVPINRISVRLKQFEEVPYSNLHLVAVPKLVDCYLRSNSILL